MTHTGPATPPGRRRRPLRRPPRRPPRWGLRTLGFLLLGFVAVFTAQAMGRHTVGTLGSSALALAGATYCSVMGVRGSRQRVADLMHSRETRR